MSKKKLVFHSGDGFGGLPLLGDFMVKSEKGEENFKDYPSARKRYNRLKCEKAFWYGGELIECMVYEDEIEMSNHLPVR